MTASASPPLLRPRALAPGDLVVTSRRSPPTPSRSSATATSRCCTWCSTGASPTLPEIVLDVLGDRDIPVLGNVEFGHAGPNLPMPVGIRVALDAGQRTLALLEPAVRAAYG
ncbi:hypothetical protein [Micromonospora sp. NPDC049282]|uniref:hypothetical protein n=1 Tax=Micromonospora sp. NPDC049282 TaxID=3364269 RepID=UPI003711E5EC